MTILNSYHNHTKRCHHAYGEDVEYVEAAIAGGYKTFGFSDHAPHRYKGEYVSSVRMLPEELREYVQSIRLLKERYLGKIDIRIGLEAEYFSSLHNSDMEAYRTAGIEYLILGQHSVGNESFEDVVNIFSETSDPSVIIRYADQCIEGLKTGHYTYFAHPDCVNYTGDEKIFEEQARRMIGVAMDQKVPLELNLLGLSTGRCYPRPSFWRIVGEMGADVVIGMDAHSPSRVCSAKEIKAALVFADKYNLKLLNQVELRII